ncbi:MAG: pyrroline-5-carboxylate reductase [Gammaproteobacteria bacterium]|jgi:pyrroline-5-carboxylate reductase
MKKHTIAFIGAGNMAGSLVAGLIGDGIDPAQLRVSDPDGDKLKAIADKFAVPTFQDNHSAVTGAEVVVLAVKPQILRTVAEELANDVQSGQPLVISVAAGIREPDLTRWLGGNVAVVRAMPNTPALVRSGATALYGNAQTRSEQRDLAESVLRAVGLALWLDDEGLMDAVTALSGSGPAYFFLVMEALQEAGRQLGLPAETARLLTLQTAFGAAKMALESADEPAVLRQRVTSPGGTTEKAVGVLEDGALRGLFLKALQAAAARSRELAEQAGDR